MADKDKKKLKVILKLPPKSSSAQLKSNPAAAPVANNAHASALSAFSAPPTTSHKISNSKNAHSRSHGSGAAAAAALSPAPAAPASSSGPLFHTSATFSSVRSTSNSSGPSAALPAASSASLHVSSPQPSSRNPTPPKKRKFKSVEHAGAIGVGAAGSTATAGAAPASVRDGGGAGGPTSVRGGGGAGGTKFVREGGGIRGTTKGGGGGGKGEGGGLELGGGGGVGGRKAGAVPALSPFPVIKKSHKKQVKPPIPTDGPQPHNPFAGVILPPKAPSEPLSRATLEGVLEKLQKKDTYAVFAEPVDADQVPDYYDIIKEPMDFGTMRKKIKKGSYFTLEQFEGDIHLICTNAMRYNGPDTIYYKQAKAIRDMARKALEGIGVQLGGELRKPVSHKKKLSPSKKSHTKKPALSKVRLDGTGSDFTSGATLAGDGEHRGWSNSTVDAGKAKKGISMEKLVGLGEDSADAWVAQPAIKESKVDAEEEPIGAVLKPMGPKDGRRPLSNDENHRSSYKQRLLPAHGQGPPLAAVGGESRLLVPAGNQVEHAYALSLARFGAEFGPRAWHFVEKRLERLNVPIVQEGTTNASPAGKTAIQSPSQTGRPIDSHLHAVGQSAGVGGDVSSPSGRSFSGQVADATRNHPPGVPHAGQVGVGSIPSFAAGASYPGQSKVSSPKHPSGAAQVAESVVSTPNHTYGTSQVADVVVSTQNHPSGASQGFAPNFSSGAMSHVRQGAVSAPNYSSVGTSHVGQPSGSTSTYPSGGGTSHPGQAVVSSTNFASRSSQVSIPSFTSTSSNVGQAVVPSLSSSGASHVGQTVSSNQAGVGIGSIEQGGGKDVQLSSHKVEGPDTQQGPGTGNGRLEDTRSDSLVHTSGTKQVMGLGSDAVSEDKNSLSRLGWTQAGSVTGVEQGVRGLATGATSKGFPQAWSTSLKQGPTSYAYPPVTSSSGRDEANAQAWAQARVMSLTQPTDGKRNLSTPVQGFQTQSAQLKPTANVPQNLQPNVYADYNNLVSRLPPRQSTGMSLSVPAPQMQGQHAEAYLNKSGVSEQKVSLSLHSQGNMRPSPLQKSSLQQRAMPPDLNVALLSPSTSALQSPQTQQGSTPTSSHQPDLKLQL